MSLTLCTLRFESSCHSHGEAGMCFFAHIPLTSGLSVISNLNQVGSVCHHGLFHLVYKCLLR